MATFHDISTKERHSVLIFTVYVCMCVQSKLVVYGVSVVQKVCVCVYIRFMRSNQVSLIGVPVSAGKTWFTMRANNLDLGNT